MELSTKHRIINGDSRLMSNIQDREIDLVITSPPYWQLKDYGDENQIGFDQNYEDYINNLNLVWKECYRVLDKGCRLCVNIGDQFARSVYYGRYKVIPIRTEIIKFCENIGFDYMGAVIWQKKTTTNTTGGASIMGSFPYPRNGIFSIDYEFILIFKKLGQGRKPDSELKAQSQMTKEEWKEYFSGHWNFAGAKQDGHIAMFPEELPGRLIKMFSFAGDTVLDPFLGSGTTSLAAKKLGRNSVGFEINPDFIPLIRKKLNVDQSEIIQSEYEFIEQVQPDIDYDDEIKKLPYIFHDPLTFDKKVDPKKIQFGSKIDKDSGKREEYFTVKKIISPEYLVLSNGLKIKLIGIKENSDAQREAIRFLEKKFDSQRIFLKYDSEKYDIHNNLMCYVYLKNKTFINAHLIKKGFAFADTDNDYKYKDKFLKMENING